jgi:hypothetical protein
MRFIGVGVRRRLFRVSSAIRALRVSELVLNCEGWFVPDYSGISISKC